MASFWDTITGKAASDASNAAAADTYAKQLAASTAAKSYAATVPGQYNQVAGAYAPYTRAGTDALTRLMAGLGLGGDQGAFTRAYQSLPGYQSGLNTGQQAAERAINAGGGLNSGAALKQLYRYGSDYENQRSGDYFNRLQGLSGQGLQATGAQTGLQAQGLGQGNQIYSQGLGYQYGSAPTVGQGQVAGAQSEMQGMGNLLNLAAYLGGSALGGKGGGLPQWGGGSFGFNPVSGAAGGGMGIMAAADNPYFIAPPNVYQALMSGVGGYQQGQKDVRDAAIDAASTALQAGDLRGAAAALFKARELGPALTLANLERQQQASSQFGKDLGAIFAPGGQTNQQPVATPSYPSSGFRNLPANIPETVSAPPTPSANIPTPMNISSGEPLGTYYGQTTNQKGEVIAQGGYVPESTVSPTPGSTAPIVPKSIPTQTIGRSSIPQPPQTIGPAPSLGGVSLDKAVPALLAAAVNPALEKSQQETARMLLGKAIDQYPQEIRKLEIYKARPDLFQLALQEKTAGATMINTAEGMDAAQAKARIAIDQHAVQNLSQKVAASHSAYPILNRMIEMGDKVPGGWAGPASALFAKAASALGIPVPEGASNAELVNSMSRQFIPSVRDPGSTSNYEQQLYVAAVPSLLQSTEGRLKIAQMFKATLQRNQDALAIYRQYIGRPELDQKLMELDQKPMFAPADVKYLQNVASSGGGTSGTTSTKVPWSFNQ